MAQGPETLTDVTSGTTGQILDRRKSKERKIGHRRVNEEGEITFKKIQTSQIMGSIQLGISNAVGSLASKPERDLLMQDFMIVETTNFLKDGSNLTPAHHYSDFKFKSYAPIAFRYFRDLFGIQPDDFLLSLCNYPLIELTNPGASGSIFYLTSDDEFIIKTVQHKEAEFLQKLLPGYYMNLNQNPRTLLPKFFGLYCYQCVGKNVRLVAMNNLLPSSIKMHEKYDLKGSTYKRKASKQERKKGSPTYKDLDFMEMHTEGILLEPETYNALIKTIQRDCRVLESFKIMDYSLLIGVHNLDQAKREKLEQRKKEADETTVSKASGDAESALVQDSFLDDNDFDGGRCTEQTTSIYIEDIMETYTAQESVNSDSKLVRSKSINKQRLAAFSTAMESIQAEVEVPYEDDEDIPPGGIPAKNSKGDHLLLFLGIIDILQSYRLKKKLEHTLKSVLHDGDTISVHRPGFYAQRFQDFMSRIVFKKMPSTGQHRKFKTICTSVLALKHSPSKRKGALSKKASSFNEADVSRASLSKIPSESDCPPEEDSISPDPVPFPSTSSETTSTNVSSDIKPNTSWSSSSRGRQKSRSNIDPVSPKMVSLRNAGKTQSSAWEKIEVVSSETTTDCASETSSSSTSGFGSMQHTVMWTPPHSVEGSTPTHTEGTPSYTESSSSGDVAFPTTPVKSMKKSLDSLPPLGETLIVQGSEMMKS